MYLHYQDILGLNMNLFSKLDLPVIQRHYLHQVVLNTNFYL